MKNPGCLLPLDQEVLLHHEQKNTNSCVPMSVELLLKLAKIKKMNFYDFQYGLGGVRAENGHGSEYHEKSIENVVLEHKFNVERGTYNVDELINYIIDELDEGRYVQISLENDPNSHIYHCWVVWGHSGMDLYAVTRYYNQSNPTLIQDVSEQLRAMGGTDILVYRYVK